MKIAIRCSRCQRTVGRRASHAAFDGTMIRVIGRVIEHWALFNPCKGCKVSGR